MKGRLLFCLALFACGDDDNAVGIEIRVPDSLAGVDTVELVLGVGPCLGDCAGVAPPDDMSSPGRAAIPGEVYAVDAAKILSAPVAGGVAKFRLESEATTLPAVIAIGTGNELGTVILEAIELGGGARTYEAELVFAGALLVDTPEPSATNVERWESGTSRCIGAEIADTGRRVFIVPEDDPDCDAVAAECDPFVHLSTDVAGVAEVGALACASTETILGQTNCMLGAPICDELAPDSVGCGNASQVCVSDQLCECAALDSACLQAVYATDAVDAPTTIVCKMEVVDNGGANFAPCVPQSLIGPSFVQQVGGSCSSVMTIGPVGLPLGTFGVSHTIALPAAHQLALTVHDPAGAECRMQVDWSGSFDAASGVQKLATLVKLDISSSRSVILPLVIDPVVVQVGNCTGIAGNRCDLVQAPADNVFTCVP